MDDAFEKGPESIDIGHKEEGTFNSIQIVQKVLSKFTVQVVHEKESTHSKQHHKEHEEEKEGEIDFMSEVETKHCVKVSES